MTRKTPERVALAQELRAQTPPVTYREIGERLGVSLKTVHEWITDPDRSKRKARLEQYRPTCRRCGVKLNGSDGPNSEHRPQHCVPCNGLITREQSVRWVIESVREWIDLFGQPPTATDWNPAAARLVGRLDLAERTLGTERPWPSPTLVIERFGSWNAGLRAAGVATVERGRRRDQAAHTAAIRAFYGSDERWAIIHRLWHRDATGGEIADILNTSPATVYATVKHMRQKGWDLPRRAPGRRVHDA